MNTSTILLSESKIKNITYDLIALSVITLVPAVSHMIGIPLYLLEPMRIMLLVSLFYTSPRNTFLLAIILPFFSLLISSHPSFIKAIIISTELLLNLFLFFLLKNKMKNRFFVMLLSIIVSKLYYYLLKFVFISIGLIKSDLIDTPIYIQLVVALMISFYSYLVFRKREKVIA
ncbi:MAG: hypothetical protein N2249_03085 [Melioribacter sp.]|nr:hypothetical protein [Melioribacter sp.]